MAGASANPQDEDWKLFSAPQPSGENEDWKLFSNPEGNPKGKEGTAPKAGFIQGLLENAPLQMHQWPSPDQKIPGVAESVGMAVPNFVLGGGELLRKLFSKGERGYGLGELAASLASGGPNEYIPHPYIGEPRLPKISRLSPGAQAWADVFGIKQAGYPAARALSTIHFSGGGLEPPPMVSSDISSAPFGVFSREMPSRPITVNLNAPAARTPGWEGMPAPSVAPPPDFAGTPPAEKGVTPGGKKIGGPQNIGPVPAGATAAPPPLGPESTVPNQVLDSITNALTGGKVSKFSKIPLDDPIRSRIAQEGVKFINNEALSRVEQLTKQGVKLTPESATPPITPPPSENPMASPGLRSEAMTEGQKAAQRLTQGKELAGDIHALQSQSKNNAFAQYLLDEQHYTPEQVESGLSNSDIAQHFPEVSRRRIAAGEIKQPMKVPEQAGKIGREWPDLRLQFADAMREILAKRAGKNYYE